MRTKREYLERRAAALDEAEALTAAAETEKRAMTETEATDFEARMSEVSDLDRKIALAERRDDQQRRGEGRTLGDDPMDAAKTELRALMRGEVRAMSIGTPGDGGHAVPEQIDRMVASQLLDVSPIRRIASVVTTASSDYKKLVNVRGATSGWSAETGTRSATDTPTLEQVTPPGGELYAYASATNWLLDDAMFDVEAFLRQNVVDEFALQEGAAFVAGNGTNKPKGFATYTTAATADASRAFGTLEHHLAAATGAATGDELIELVYKLRPSYRQGEGVAWVMNSTTASVIRKLKDAEGRYLWSDSLTAGQPAQLLGYAVVEAEDMPDLGAGALPIAFGNWRRGYQITDRVGMTMIRDNITQPGWTKFYFAKRTGGAVIDSNAIKFLKMAAS